VAAPAAPAALPAANTEGARALLSRDETLQVLDFPRTGSTTVQGRVVGARATAHAVPVAAGQTLTVTFRPSNPSLTMNIHDAKDSSGAALHRGEIDGNTAKLTATTATTYLIRPGLPRNSVRRGTAANYSLTVARD